MITLIPPGVSLSYYLIQFSHCDCAGCVIHKKWNHFPAERGSESTGCCCFYLFEYVAKRMKITETKQQLRTLGDKARNKIMLDGVVDGCECPTEFVGF